MRRSLINPGSNLSKLTAPKVIVILLLVVGALLLQRLVGAVNSQNDLTQDKLVEQLRAQDMQLTVLGTAYAPLPIRGQRIDVGSTATGGVTELQVYDVSGQQIAIQEGTITTVSSDGATGVDVRSWHVPLVVFKQGDLLVLCFGHDEEVINALTSILGPSVIESQT